MSDKEYIMDTLDTLKSLSVNMTYAMNEASCEKLYKEYYNMFKEINKETKEVFDLAYKLGYYTLESEEEKKIGEKVTHTQALARRRSVDLHVLPP